MSKYLVISFGWRGVGFKVIREPEQEKPKMTTEHMLYHAAMGDDYPGGCSLYKWDGKP